MSSKYTDTENRRAWGKLDKDALNYTISEYEVDYSRICDIIEEFELNSNDINAHFYGALYVAGVDFVDKVKEYCDEKEISYENTLLEDALELLNIYTNYLDSGYDSIISDYIQPNPSEDDILKVLEILDIKIEELEQENNEIEENNKENNIERD